MEIDFSGVNHLKHRKIRSGERWIYSADFNVACDSGKIINTRRIDVEIPDIMQISESGGITAILAHKGRFGDADDLDFVVPYLSTQLSREVRYFRENNTAAAEDSVKNLRPGEIALLGNTRKHPGEEKNSRILASEFARLGDYVAVGGFGKAHRENASNVGILEYLPGYAAGIQLNEMRLLSPWAGREEVFSVAAIGGIKKEKITIGLAGFARNYDIIMPGGIVLNTVLKVMNYEIGDSIIEDGGKTFEKDVMDFLESPYAHKIRVPSRIVIAKRKPYGFEDPDEIEISNVPKGYSIVDYVMSPEDTDYLNRAVEEKGRIVLAGALGAYKSGFTLATDSVLSRMRHPQARGIVLGGDTSTEVAYDIQATGGGSALYFLAHGTTPVFEALKKNKRNFPA